MVIPLQEQVNSTDAGVVAPSPACLRALKTVTEVLQKNGHEVVTL